MKLKFLIAYSALLLILLAAPLVLAQDPFTWEGEISPQETGGFPLIPISETESMDVTISSDIPITVFRDNNRDSELDVTGVDEQQGLHAVNIHRASRVRASTRVDKWSAGCQVVQDPDHFDFLMTLCDRGAQKFGNSFTYTLLESDDFTA